jgi:hypothetical protein
MAGPAFTLSKKQILFNKQSGLCYYCNCEMLYLDKVPSRTTPAPNTATIEHLITRWDDPHSLIRNKIENQVLACWLCNQIKGEEKKLTISTEDQIIHEAKSRKKWKISHLIKHNLHFQI